MASSIEDPMSIFREREVIYRGILHPRLGEGDRCLVRTDAVDETAKMPAEIIAIRMYRKYDVFEFLVHFDHLPDRRFDIWVTENLISDVVKAPKEDETNATVASPLSGSKRTGLRRKRTQPPDEDSDERVSSKDLEDDEFRQHEEYTKVKYVSEVHVGNHLMSVWYFSPFAREILRYKRVHICPTCLSQFILENTYGYHYSVCETNSPPGHLLYCTDKIAIYEVDGLEEKLYCQLLSLLGKCFIKEKTLVHYVDDFKFYVLCELRKVDDRERHEVVGYFSKEKRSDEGYNLACLVVLPPFTNKGYGSLLIDLSYHISRREKRVGTPERPLSAMGEKAYLSYWSFVIVQHLWFLMQDFKFGCDHGHRLVPQMSEDDGEVEESFAVRSIEDVSRDIGIDPDDIRLTLMSMSWTDLGIDGDSLYLTEDVLETVYMKMLKKYTTKGSGFRPLLINPERLKWATKTFKVLN